MLKTIIIQNHCSWLARIFNTLLLLTALYQLPGCASHANKETKAPMSEAVISQEKRIEQQSSKQTSGTFKPLDIGIEGAPYLGKADAPVVLLEFTDYQCPYCFRHAIRVRPRLIKDFVMLGKLKYVVREFPLQPIHTYAIGAAIAAQCSRDQGKYWEMQEIMFNNQHKLSPEDLGRYADSIGLNQKLFHRCFASGRYNQQIRNDLLDGANAGVRGTPSFFLGLSDSVNPTKFKATRFFHGSQTYSRLKQAIDDLIADSDSAP